MKRKTAGRHTGFSLIELVIIFFICATLLLLVVGLATRSRDFARTMGCISNIRQIAMAIDTYQMDWKVSPEQIIGLVPAYLPSVKTLHCPADLGGGNSYENDYVARVFSEDDPGKAFLICNRHSWQKRATVGYLSYSAAAAEIQSFSWQDVPASFRTPYSGGTLRFADGTTVSILEGTVGVLSSFKDFSGNTYTILYVPDTGEPVATTRVEVTHSGDSRFEIVDPCVIAGVAGTRFRHETRVNGESVASSVYVMQGAVDVIVRSTPMRLSARPGEGTLTTEATRTSFAPSLNKVPKRAKVKGARKDPDKVI